MTPSLVQASANHLWQSAVFVVLAWLLTLVLRRNRALVMLAGYMGWQTAPAHPKPAVLSAIVPTTDQLRSMLRTLLKDRFALSLHRETRKMPVYDLQIGKNGTKLKVAPADEKPSGNASAQASGAPKRFARTDEPMLIAILSNFLDRPVIDNTGLQGRYEFHWDQQELIEELRQDGKPAPSIFSAVQEQLGLKLEKQDGPVEVLIIDHAAKPSEN